MNWFSSFYGTTLGKKAVMALTGIALWAFVVGHMAGNLKLLLGAESINHYAEWLREVGQPLLPRAALLWTLRIGLIAAAVLHVHAAAALTAVNWRARPVGYARREDQRASVAARAMRWSGVALLLFVVYHLMHMTWGTAHPDFVPGDVYHNLMVGFRGALVTAVYLTAMILLGFHLWHGLWSMFQSLGWSHPRYNRWRRGFAVFFTLLVVIGFIVIPLAIFGGLVRGTP